MKRTAALGLALALVACGRDTVDWSAMSGGHPTTPLPTIELKQGKFEFRAYVEPDGTPGIAYSVPGHSGGVRLVAVGEKGGWALEPNVVNAGNRDIVYGAAIPAATRIEATAGGADTVTLPGHAYRYFVFATPEGTHLKNRNDVLALDSTGRTLGQPHHNVGTAAKPDYGPYDGSWDRAHKPK